MSKFIHDPGKDNLDQLPPIHPEGNQGPGGTYGPYLVNRWNNWDDRSQQAGIYFTMSTWIPYQPQLIRARLKLERR